MVKRSTAQMIDDIEGRFGIVGVYAVQRYLEMEVENTRAESKPSSGKGPVARRLVDRRNRAP
jgi:hypothetical protein